MRGRRRESVAPLPTSGARFAYPAPELHEYRFIGPEVDDQVRQIAIPLRHEYAAEGVVLREKTRHLPESRCPTARLNEPEVLDRKPEICSRLYPRAPCELPQLPEDRTKFLIAALARADDDDATGRVSWRCWRVVTCHGVNGKPTTPEKLDLFILSGPSYHQNCWHWASV